MRTPNILFILIDALRAQNLGCYNPEVIKSPSPCIDELARKGVIFKHCYSCITNTDPAMTSIFSGRYPISHGIIAHGHRIKKAQIERLRHIRFLPEILKSRDYYTIAIDWLGRWHQRGYDSYSGMLDPRAQNIMSRENSMIKQLQRICRVADEILCGLTKRDLFTRIFNKLSDNKYLGYDQAHSVTDVAVDFIQKNSQATKFFLFVHYWDCHFPYSRPLTWASVLLDPVERRYDAEISFIDQQIERLMRALEKRGVRDETLVIITSDHGESLIEHGIYCAHRGLYDNVIRVPLILNYSGLPRGKRIQSLVQHVDVVPTILDIVGEPADQLFDGNSLMPLINGQKPQWRTAIYCEDLHPPSITIRAYRKRAIRTKTHKYIQTFRDGEHLLETFLDCRYCSLEQEELYDLKNDPHERKNIIASERDLADNLKCRLEKLMESVRLRSNLLAEQDTRANSYKESEEEKVLDRLAQLGYL